MFIGQTLKQIFICKPGFSTFLYPRNPLVLKENSRAPFKKIHQSQYVFNFGWNPKHGAAETSLTNPDINSVNNFNQQSNSTLITNIVTETFRVSNLNLNFFEAFGCFSFFLIFLNVTGRITGLLVYGFPKLGKILKIES